MDIKNLINETVIHQSFGKGVIQNVYDNYLEIDFRECNKRSKFIYPSCFHTFLKLENEEKGKDIAEDLEQWKIDSGAAQKEKLRKQYEKTQQEIKARKLAAEEKREKMKQRAREFRSRQNQGKNGSNYRKTVAEGVTSAM